MPPSLLQAVEDVRQHLRTATDFGELFERFDDHIARAPSLREHSHRREEQHLFSIAVTLAARYRPGFQPFSCRLYEIGDTGFLHGAVMGNNAMACLFYDERVGVGLVAVSNAFDGSNRTELFRFGPPRLGPPPGGDTVVLRGLPC